MRKGNSLGCVLLIAAMVLVMVISFAIFALFDFLQAKLLLRGEDWLFYEPMPYAQKLITIPVVVLILEAAMALIYRLTGATFTESSNQFVNFIIKHKIPVIIICILMLYVGFTGVSSAGEDGVTARSALNPMGTHYEMELISSVDTGFNKRGDFYYNINVDGKTLKFSVPTANYEKHPEYEEETYKEFLDFDQKLMAAGVTKNADVASLERSQYDESCMKYFRQIVK